MTCAEAKLLPMFLKSLQSPAKASPHKSRRALSFEGCPEFLLGKRNLPHDRKLHLEIVHFLHVFAPALAGWDNGAVDDLDASWLCAVTPSHFGIHLADIPIDGDITVLLVHVVRVCAAF